MALTVTEPEAQESYPIYRFLDTVGDGTGTHNAVGDYTTPIVLRCDVRPNEIITGHLLIVHIQDSGTFDPAKYGVLAALTNGIHVGLYGVDGVEKLRLTQDPVKDHGDWTHYGLSSEAAAGAGGVMFVVHIDLAGGLSDGVKMYPGESMQVHLSDNLTGLDDHHFILHGGRRKQ